MQIFSNKLGQSLVIIRYLGNRQNNRVSFKNYKTEKAKTTEVTSWMARSGSPKHFSNPIFKTAVLRLAKLCRIDENSAWQFYNSKILDKTIAFSFSLPKLFTGHHYQWMYLRTKNLGSSIATKEFWQCLKKWTNLT